MNQNGTCKLCGKSAKLLKKSHIIPNFMYEGMWDEKNRIIQANLNNADEQFYMQSGPHEKYILCSKCDNDLLGELEKYTAHIIFGGRTKHPAHFENRISSDGIKSIHISNVDYTKFKLCILSILWRAHISKNRYFQKIDIADSEKQIRKMLNENNANSEDDYKVSVLVMVDTDNNPIKLCVNPDISNIGQGKIATFLINGIVYIIETVPNSGFKLLDKFFLKSSGEIEIPTLERSTANGILKALGLPANLVDQFLPV